MRKHTNLQIKLETKQLLEKAAYALSHEYGERVTLASLLDICVQDGIEKAVAKRREQLNFDRTE
jgi:hypothetical protein